MQQWTASYLSTTELTPACRRPTASTSQCQRVVAVEPGVFTFSAQAGTKLDCLPSGGVCAECGPDGNGGCTTIGALIAGALLSAEAKVTLDGSYGVGGSGGDGLTRAVEIVFKQ